MKLSITQIILGFLIVLAAAYIAWWMIFGVEALLDLTVLNESGVVVPDVTPVNKTLFTISRYASGVLLGLGLLILLAGSLWKVVKNKKRLAITQIIAGALTVFISIFILVWGCAFNFIVAIEGGIVFNITHTIQATIFTALLGLAIAGTGIAQFIKTRRISE